MSNKIFVGFILTILIIAGYVVYSKYNPDQAEEVSGTGISFMCEDGSGFIAEFAANMTEVDIIVSGQSAYVLPNTGDELVPYRFANDARVYTFVGEEAVVANLGANTSVVCRQPFDQNNAPYNFGDAGEGGGDTPDLVDAVLENILGSWRSTDDAKFTREFKADGVIIDHYEEVEDTAGSWNAFTSNDNLETPFPQTPNTVYLRVVMNDFPEEVLYFELAKLTPEDLELFFLGRGGVLSFTRVNEN